VTDALHDGPVRVFIGTEPRMWIAEAVLRYSILAHASIPVEIVSMDYSRGGVWAGWNIGRPHGHPTSRERNDLGHRVWFTDFTNFRWAIPEVCGFKGRAIYLDVDILVIGDIAELWRWPSGRAILSLDMRETSVMLYECERFAEMPGWPAIEQMKANGWGIDQYYQLLAPHGAFGQLPVQWNCLDGKDFAYTTTRLIHYTNMSSQPWRPYPERLHYNVVKNTEVEDLWFYYAERARRDGWFDNPPTLSWPGDRPRFPRED